MHHLAHTTDYPIVITDAKGERVDAAGNVESAVSVAYGDLDGARPFTFHVPNPYPDAMHDAYDVADRLRLEAEINADCWGIPVDAVIITKEEK